MECFVQLWLCFSCCAIVVVVVVFCCIFHLHWTSRVLAVCEMRFSNQLSGWVLHGMFYWIIAKQWKFVCSMASNRWNNTESAYVQTALLILCEIKHFDLHAATAMDQWFFYLFIIKLRSSATLNCVNITRILFHSTRIYNFYCRQDIPNWKKHKIMNNYLFRIIHIHERICIAILIHTHQIRNYVTIGQFFGTFTTMTNC